MEFDIGHAVLVYIQYIRVSLVSLCSLHLLFSTTASKIVSNWKSIYKFKNVTLLPLAVCGSVGGFVALVFFIASYVLHLLILGSCYTAHKCIVNVMKVYIKRNNIQVELIRFRKKIATLLTFETFKWEYSFATNVLIAIRDEAPMVCRGPCAPDVSEHSHFGTCHIGTSTIRDCTTALFQVTMYRQFTRKVGTSAIHYHLLRLKLSSSTRDCG